MAQNDWQKKNQRQVLTARDIYAEMIETMRQEVVNHKEGVISGFIREQTGSTIIFVEEVARRGHLIQAPDGSEVFCWDDQPAIYFAPVDMQEVNGTMRPTLKYQMLPLATEPDFSNASDEFKMYLALARENGWNIPVSNLYKEDHWIKNWKEYAAELPAIEPHH